MRTRAWNNSTTPIFPGAPVHQVLRGPKYTRAFHLRQWAGRIIRSFRTHVTHLGRAQLKLRHNAPLALALQPLKAGALSRSFTAVLLALISLPAPCVIVNT